jgi:FHA domain
MDIAGKARKLEQRISRTVDAAVEEFIGRTGITPIELLHAVLSRAETEIQDIGRGRRVFPFNRVRVHVMAAPGDRKSRARFSAVLDGPPSLGERLADHLRASGCTVDGIQAEIQYARRRGAGWADADFHVEFDRADVAVVSPVRPTEIDAAGRIRLSVVKGSAAQRNYAFGTGRIDIGRSVEIVDQRQRLLRTNHLAFGDEGSDVNRTVSRRHAHIEYGESEGCYRIWDDRSAHGTTIIRNGRTIKVTAGARGVKLQSHDEIALGHARLKVMIET